MEIDLRRQVICKAVLFQTHLYKINTSNEIAKLVKKNSFKITLKKLFPLN